MARRLGRRVPLVSGLAPIRNSIARTQSQINRGFARYAPATTPQGSYLAGQPTVITGGYASKLVPGSGTLTIYVGPMGVGTVWYPQSVAIATTTGAADASTCTVYLSPLQNGPVVAPTTQIAGQSYAGGGDTIGLAVPPMWPGTFIVAQWSGANPGDLASMQIYGQQRTLTA
jgi:hypothetical protein